MKKVMLSLLLVLPFLVKAQENAIPKVFMLGENEQAYEQLTRQYTKSLLEASNMDIEAAFDHWLDMMKAMDAYAAKINYDLKGVRIWFHVFWSPEGKIDHIGYLLRQDSRNVKTDEIRAFLLGFIKQYQLPLKSDQPFNHYTGVTFPTLVERTNN